jgi:hypothetical protein
MKLQDAIATVGAYAPCPHDSFKTYLGTTWGKCPDCGESFSVGSLWSHRYKAEAFRDALKCFEVTLEVIERVNNGQSNSAGPLQGV